VLVPPPEVVPLPEVVPPPDVVPLPEELEDPLLEELPLEVEPLLPVVVPLPPEPVGLASGAVAVFVVGVTTSPPQALAKEAAATTASNRILMTGISR
jgi:hypothetical protein